MAIFLISIISSGKIFVLSLTKVSFFLILLVEASLLEGCSSFVFYDFWRDSTMISLHWQPLSSARCFSLSRRLIVVFVSLLALFALSGSGGTIEAHAASTISSHAHRPLDTVPSQAIVPGGSWTDTSGKSLQAHGAGLIKVGSTYYWFGENRTDNNWLFEAISCYSSTDLVNWTFRKNVLTLQSSGDLGPNRIVERPKVIYNASTQTFVMYLHIDNTSYGEAKVGVATSKTVDGDYTYQGSYNPRGNESRDMTVFEDTDGSAYLIYATSNNYALNIDKLSSDYLSDVSSVYTFSSRLEAPGMFKVNGRYYLIASSPTGWAPNPNTYVSATSLSGPWTSSASLAPNSPNTYDSQDAFILPVVGTTTTTYIYMGDRWDSTALGNSRYIWLPLSFSGANISLSYYDVWRINVGTGQWSAISTTSYEAEASTNTLSGGAVVMSCSNCSGGKDVGYLGNNSGTLQFNGVSASHSGSYLLTIYYANGDSAARTASVSINGGTATTLSFASSHGGGLVATLPVTVQLNAGNNTILFSNASSWAPDIDKITLAS
jgi:hypothetical protein